VPGERPSVRGETSSSARLDVRSVRTVLSFVLIFAACAQPPAERLVTYQRFLELSRTAAEEKAAPRDAVVRGGSPFEVRSVRIHGDTRPSLVLTAPAEFMFQGTIQPETSFRFSLAVRPPEAPVRIRVTRMGGNSLYEETWLGSGPRCRSTSRAREPR